MWQEDLLGGGRIHKTHDDKMRVCAGVSQQMEHRPQPLRAWPADLPPPCHLGAHEKGRLLGPTPGRITVCAGDSCAHYKHLGRERKSSAESDRKVDSDQTQEKSCRTY